MRAAPLYPPPGPEYLGRSDAMRAARYLRSAAPRFLRFRSAIPLGTWRSDPSHIWRVRSTKACHGELRRLGVKFRRWEPDPEDEEAPENLHPVPSPVIVREAIYGVRYVSYRGPLLISCELAARLPAVSKIMKANDVERVVIASHYRSRPLQSFHRMGLALDVPTIWVKTALTGTKGPPSKALKVKHDFLETPNTRTCDPTLFGPTSPLQNNERGRRLLQISCDLYKSGTLSSILTPNYNPGHRDHFHFDARPDDPRIFVR